MALDLDAVRADAEKDMTPEWLERCCDASWAAALHALGEPVSAELEAKAAAQIKKNREASRVRSWASSSKGSE